MGKIHGFHGADGKTGTTMITQSVAELIASHRKDIKVMMISVHGRPGTEYADRVEESIENIKLHLENRLLDPGRLIEECRQGDNLYMLGGVQSIGQVRSYQPDMAAYLLESIEDSFDLILADTGNDIDNGLAVGALEYIGDRYCIVTQQESILSRYERVKPVYDKLGIHFSCCIVNRYIDGDAYDLHYIAQRLGLDREELLQVGASECERQAEVDHRTLLSFKNEYFCRGIQSIANRVLAKAEMDPIDFGRKKKWMPFT